MRFFSILTDAKAGLPFFVCSVRQSYKFDLTTAPEILTVTAGEVFFSEGLPMRILVRPTNIIVALRHSFSNLRAVTFSVEFRVLRKSSLDSYFSTLRGYFLVSLLCF